MAIEGVDVPDTAAANAADKLQKLREQRRKWNRRWYEKRRSTPEGLAAFRAAQNRISFAYYHRKKGDPSFKAKINARSSAYYHSGRGKEKQRLWLSSEKGQLHRERHRLQARQRRRSQRVAEVLHDGYELRRALLANAIYASADRAVPRSLPPFVRDDVISELCLGVLAGDFAVEEIAEHVKAATARHRGLTNRFDMSLDDALGDDGFTRGTALGVY